MVFSHRGKRLRLVIVLPEVDDLIVENKGPFDYRGFPRGLFGLVVRVDEPGFEGKTGQLMTTCDT